MAKIKDCVVVQIEIIDTIIDLLITEIVKSNNKEQREYLNSTMLLVKAIKDRTKPLEPIIKDTWKQKDTTLFDYLNETEL